MKKKIILIYLLFSSFLTAQILEISNEPLYKTNNYFNYALADFPEEKPVNTKDKVWEVNKNSFNNFKNLDKAYWIKLIVKNTSSDSKTYYLKSENQFTYRIDYYLIKNKNIVKHIEDGVVSKNSKREFNTNHMIFPLTLSKGEEVTVLFKIQNYNKIDIDFTLVTKEYLLDYYQTYNIVEGLFFGGMILMMFYNLFLYFLLKFRPYLYYVLYTFWLIIYFIGLFGFSQRYFEAYTWIFYISSGAFFVFLTLFIQSILHLKEKLPQVNKYLNIYILYFIIATLTNIIALEFEHFYFAQLLFNLSFSLVPIYVILIISSTYYLAYKKNDFIAQIYSLVWTIIAIVGFLLPLVYLNIINIDIPSDYLFQFLILFEVLCFSLILAYKIRLIEYEKKEQEKMLIQQSKLASMGEMISVIAHQWRQPLSEINGIILNMEVDYQKDKLSKPVFSKHLDDIEMTTSYMSHTIHDFIDFFKQNKKVEKFFVSEVINNAFKLLNISHEKTITIDYKNIKDIEICTYKSELIQALLIIINNATDACLNNLNESSKIQVNTHSKNKHLYISIIDNGSGIPSDILEKIYEPYFTTKHKSKGTGLGLYILKMIIEQNMKGKIEIKSSSIGTKCNIIIPINCE